VAAWEPKPPTLRASDADRERAIRVLRGGSVDGRLSHESFVQRVDLALRARGSAELAELVTDLTPPGPVTRNLARAIRWWSTVTARLAAAWQTPRLPPLVLPRGDRTVFTIGRDNACDLSLSHLSVSRRHAELRHLEDEWVLVDLDSTNGTRANGWSVGPGLQVRPGDCVTFGELRFRLADHA
jgi:hypothetical protein